MVIDYSRGKIYRMVSEVDPNMGVYVGSTCRSLSRRLSQHRADYRNRASGKRTCRSSLLFERGDVSIYQLESYPCSDKDELRARERYWMERTPNCINTTRPIVTAEEARIESRQRWRRWSDDNREYDLEKKRENYQQKRGYILHKVECSCGSIFNWHYVHRHFRSRCHQRWVDVSNGEMCMLFHY